MSESFLIWDKPNRPEFCENKTVILFNELSDQKGFLSLPKYLETNAVKLRSKYLDYISQIGHQEVEEQSIAQHLDIDDGISYWWMSTIVEKSPFKSPGVYKSVLMLALEELFLEFSPSDVAVFSDTPEYCEIIKGICDRLDTPCSCEFQSVARFKIPPIKLSPFLLGIASVLKRFGQRYKASLAKKPDWCDEGKDVSIFSYFTHLSATHCADNIHYSLMWTDLPRLLVEKGWTINWTQHYLPSDGKVTLEEGLNLLDSFNSSNKEFQRHEFLDRYLSVAVLIKAFRSWCNLRKKVKSLKATQVRFQVKNSGVNLWPLLKKEWNSSTLGQTAAINCLWVALFDSAIRDKPLQKLGLYLHEGQAWEFALLAAWRKYGHGRIISVQHATVPFWHLYYFNNPSVYLSTKSHGMPTPDLWSVNGPHAYNAFLSSGYPVEKIIMLEALRYLDKDEQKKPQQLIDESLIKRASMDLKILVVGDLMPDSMRIFVLALKKCIDLLPENYQFTFKPHPADNSNICEYLGLNINQTQEPLEQILKGFDIVIGSNSTSATTEAYLAGVKPIVFLDTKTFNLSPLRSCPGADFVSSTHTLFELLTSENYLSKSFISDEEFFLSHPGLERWDDLLLSSSVV